VATAPLGLGPETPSLDQSPLDLQSQSLMRLSVRFDPYSPTAESDYEALKEELVKIDIISLLKAELTESRIHVSLSRKIVAAIRYIDEPQRSDAVLSLIENSELLYPIYANVLLVAKSLYADLREDVQIKIIDRVRNLIKKQSHVMQTELNLSYAVHLLACADGSENEEVFNKIYGGPKDSSLVRKDVILAMGKLRADYWLSGLKPNFRNLPPAERRAFLLASFTLADEGKHWRQHIRRQLSPFEKLVRDWAAERFQSSTWQIPL